MSAILPDTGELGLVIPWGQCRTGNALCSNKDQSCQCLCLLLHQLWNTNAWWKMTSIRKRQSTWALAGSTYIHVQGLPRKEGREVLGRRSMVGHGSDSWEFSLHLEFWKAHAMCAPRRSRLQHRLARMCEERQSKGFLPGLGSPGRREQGSVEGH